MFPESNLQVTKHILLSERKLQENIEEHVMRMEVRKISTRWLPQALILFTSSPAACSIAIGNSSIQPSFRVQHVHMYHSYCNLHLETIHFVLNKICDLWKKIKLCLGAKVTLTSQFCFQLLQASTFFSSYWNRYIVELYHKRISHARICVGSTQQTIFVSKKVGSMQGRAKLRGTRNALRILPRAGPMFIPLTQKLFLCEKLLLTRGARSAPCAERATRWESLTTWDDSNQKLSLIFLSKYPKSIFNSFFQVRKNHLLSFYISPQK